MKLLMYERIHNTVHDHELTLLFKHEHRTT